MSTPFLNNIVGIPKLGFGIGFQTEYAEAILNQVQQVELANQLDFIEVITENFMAKGGRTAEQLEQLLTMGFPVVSHGVSLSLGSVDPLNKAYLAQLKQLFEVIDPPWFSDHLSFSSVGGQYLNDLLPLPFSYEAAAVCSDKIKFLQDTFQKPFLIENASAYLRFMHPDGLNEAQFMTHIVETADCGLLLDVNNVFVNSQNHQEDALAFLSNIPLERVVELHIAGHLETDNLLIDTHGEPIRSEVFELLGWVYPRCPNLKGVLLERDTNLPPFDVLMAEFEQVKLTAMASLSAGAVIQAFQLEGV
jgi:uncharacterized protein (UPF0276 family)